MTPRAQGGHPSDSSSGPPVEGCVGHFEKNVTVTESRRKKQHLHGLHITGFLGQCRIVWLLDTGSVRNILSYQTYSRLPKTLQFPLHEEGTQVFLADGQSTKTYGMGNTTVRNGTQEIKVIGHPGHILWENFDCALRINAIPFFLV